MRREQTRRHSGCVGGGAGSDSQHVMVPEMTHSGASFSPWLLPLAQQLYSTLRQLKMNIRIFIVDF